MYETEANARREPSSTIPRDVLAEFGALEAIVIERTALPWSEHCTECVWPTCYSSCDIYEPREDGRCRRFVDGMVRIDCAESLNGYLLKITFKRWAKLWAPGNLALNAVETVRRREARDYMIGKRLAKAPLPRTVRGFAARKRYSLKKKAAHAAHPAQVPPDSFLVESYNPETEAVGLSLTVRAASGLVTIPFQRLIEVQPGFNRVRIPYSEIASLINISEPFNVELVPNSRNNQVTLIFGVMDFVRETPARVAVAPAGLQRSPQKVKCVVWDLDRTLWDGVLIEDGPDKISLKAGMKQILKELDRRGILLSVASKNNAEDATSALQRTGVADLFLAPQISWGPKSEALQRIAHALNIGIDTLLFVDDSAFEREEVSTAFPEVRTIDAADYRAVLNLEDCQVPITTESQSRRKMYKLEAERNSAAAGFSGDYQAFLRHCDIRVSISRLTGDTLERVHELTQRTNQMNFSGTRYDRQMLRTIMSTPWLDTFVIDVEDRFGTYGTVGFSLVDSRAALVTDLMFSCRVQSKRVEHAVLAWLIQQYRDEGTRDVCALYRRTPRNAQAGAVFEDLGMQEISSDNGVARLAFPKEQTPPEDGLITILVKDTCSVA